MAELGNNERRMLRAMLSNPESTWSLNELLEACEWTDQAHVAGAGLALNEAGMVEIQEVTTRLITLGEERRKALNEGLLESRLFTWIQNQPDEQRLISTMSQTFEKSESGPGVGLLKRIGVALERGAFVLPENISEIETILESRTNFIQSICEYGI